MKLFKILLLCVLVVGLASTVGCGGSEAERLADQQIAEMENMLEAIEAGKGGADFDAIRKRGEELAKKFAELELTDEEKAAIAEKMKAAEERFKERVQKAMQGKPGEMMSKGMDKLNQSMPSGFGDQ